MSEQGDPADKILGADYEAALEVQRKKAWDALPAPWRARLERLVAVDENGVCGWYLVVESDPDDNEFMRFVARPDRDPQTITVDEVAEWVATLAETMKPGTIQLYVIAFRLLLDYCNVDPNPARDPRVKLPKRVREEPNPPPAEHVIAILEAIHDPLRRLLFVTLEQGALRLGEAVSLRWGDVDRAGLRLRLPRSATKRDKARWVYLPEWLVEAIEETCPLEDRTPERRVFQGITEATAYQTMLRACQTAGVPHYHPHDLRHRRITIWHQSGVPARELAERAGHSRPSMSLDVYSHVMPADEVSADRFRYLLTERR